MTQILKILLFSFVLSFGANLTIGAGEASGEPTKVKLKEKPNEGNNDRPQAPVYSPVYCVVGDGTVTVVNCEYDAMGVVTVTDAESGSLIASASGMLGEGIMIMLPADRGSVRIEVEMSGTIYYAVI